MFPLSQSVASYEKMKKWCDEYFLIAHRGETRGCGGIFYDDKNDAPAEDILAFATSAAAAVAPAYCPIVKKRKDMAFTPEQKNWQQVRMKRLPRFRPFSLVSFYAPSSLDCSVCRLLF